METNLLALQYEQAALSEINGARLPSLLVALVFEPDGFTSGSIGLYGNSRCSRGSVCLCVCDAWVCTDHEIYVVAVIVAS